MEEWNIALGFYQSNRIADAVLTRLHKEGLQRAASIHRSHDGHIFIKEYFPHRQLIISLIGAIFLFFFSFFLLKHDIYSFTATLLVTVVIAVLCEKVFFSSRIHRALIRRFKQWVIRDETLIIVQIDSKDIAQALALLRKVESGHPLSFLLRSDTLKSYENQEQEGSLEPLTAEQMHIRACTLALQLQKVARKKSSRRSLLQNLAESERILQDIRNQVAEAECIEQTITSSAEWLLDNSHVIQGCIEEVRRNLPKKYYQEQPKLLDGPNAGLPRIYVLCKDIIHSTANRLSRENLIAYLTSFQSIEQLTIGELWALPLMLRLCLIEGLRHLALDLTRRLKEGEYASFWGNRLLNVARRDKEHLSRFLEGLIRDEPNPSAHFAEELLDHLFDEETILPLVGKWIEEHLHSPLSDIIQQEQIKKAAQQIAFSNAIVSLITLSQLSWLEIFEAISPVDAVLNKDPSGIYPKMDFSTRDSYRQRVEKLACHLPNTKESAVAAAAVELACQGQTPLSRHVGFYLIDEGLQQLQNQIHYGRTLYERLKNSMLTYAVPIYLGCIIFFTLLLESSLFFLCIYLWDMDLFLSLLLSALALVSVSECTIQAINLLFTRLFPPFLLPKMAFATGIPEELATLVIVPTLLSSPQEIEEIIDKLEIHYLANTEACLHFGIFFDLLDAPQSTMSEDAALLELAKDKMLSLENTYGDKFFLFYRKRVWSTSEEAWIGWERKRGKLECLNRFLIGDNDSRTLLLVGDRDNLKRIRYVITLDSDTILPKDTARQLIEAIAHPLNSAKWSSKGMERGYTIIQPRIGNLVTSATQTWFSRLFSDVSNANPYTQAISEIYQDLTHEGTYHGKGIYDLHAFHHLLTGRFPQERLLSHDLIEGCYARVGFASDIILLDSFPSTYVSWMRRQHRWIRGDWQIIDWLFSQPPAGRLWCSSALSLINRWKIFDNLRRSLLAPATIALLLCSWLFAPVPLFWSILVTSAYFLPSVGLFLYNILTSLRHCLLYSRELALGLIRTAVNVSFLPHQALLAVDAITRVFFRRWISHRHLLEWAPNHRSTGAIEKNLFISLSIISLSSFALLAAIFMVNPEGFWSATPFCVLWILLPLIVYALQLPYCSEQQRQLSSEDRLFLLTCARKTWRFFDEFMGPQTNWLPPDNYQSALIVEVAMRTSPTNIGLALLAILAAYDFKYISCDQMITRIFATFQTLKKLETYEGHLLNWYDIQHLQPLFPRYVSTVDSGNFLASLWALEQGIQQMVTAPLLPYSLLEGLNNTFSMIFIPSGRESLITPLKPVQHALARCPTDLPTLIDAIETAIQAVEEFLRHDQTLPCFYEVKQLEKELQDWQSICARYFSWVKVVNRLTYEEGGEIANYVKQVLTDNGLSLAQLSTGPIPSPLTGLLQAMQQHDYTAYTALTAALEHSKRLAREKYSESIECLRDLHGICDSLDMSFLYDPERKLFTIGFHVDDRKSDSSYYDLLASEARIASLVAIAKGDVPLKHWWALGRPYNNVNGKNVLLSWGGTMFEYLMPLLFHPFYKDSLLGAACEGAVSCQISYGKKRGIPWGISESAYSALDARNTYQYRSFGVPGLGFKRNLEQDLVVSPYSSALALAVQPIEAIKNLRLLSSDKHSLNLFGDYGFYESIDFSRQKSSHGPRGVVIFAFMAHHQGMSLLAFDNILNNSPMTQRFLANPYVGGVEPLLYELIPVNPAVAKGSHREIPISRLTPFSSRPIMGMVDTPHSIIPKVNLLSNSEYSLMITNSGAGYSRWKDVDITRWRADTTCDMWGSYIYLQDRSQGKVWSAGYQPCGGKDSHYSVSFKTDKVEIRRRCNGIESIMDLFVSPEDNAEVRLLTVANLSSEPRVIELTSYCELALAPHATDRAHPAFNKLFIETQAFPELGALLAYRRLRSPEDRPLYAAHIVTSSVASISAIQYETDRTLFIGRGNSVAQPIAMKGDLSNTSGNVLDPIFSLRYTLSIAPAQRIKVAFITAIASERDKAMALIKKYGEISSSERAMEMAWTHAQLELRHLRIHQEEAQLFQKLASRILFPHAQLRPSADRLRRNKLGQKALWAYGISGDLPLLVLSIADIHEIELIKQTLIAHIFLRLRGLKIDLVILNEEATGYSHPLSEQLKRLIKSHANHMTIGETGGVFLLNCDQVPEEDLLLILAAARVHLIAARGTLRQQLVSPMEAAGRSSQLAPHRHVKEGPSTPMPYVELSHFNGIGGFTPDGKEYVINLEPNINTPAPWANVISNQHFGTIVTEVGLGSCWFGNSQSNRLTPWSNDALLNPVSDAIYIRDEVSGAFWTATPGPIRERETYRVRHGQGYSRFEHHSHGLSLDLLVFVPVDNGDGDGLSMRLQRLLLRNTGTKKRRLGIFSYTEWVLGTDKEETQTHVITEWDAESQALFAYNRYNPDFGSHLAFACSTPIPTAFTGDRTEFLGRNRFANNPAALKRMKLSDATGAAYDPCAALQVTIELDPGEEKEVIFTIGYAQDAVEARKLITLCRRQGEIESLFTDTRAYWDSLLGQISVELPNACAASFAINRWLLYQTLSCRFWARAGFYQSSGAYGFRDQLQDAMALTYATPALARTHILRACSHQFIEGDVQHWWHPPGGGGVRTRISDDLLWLPFVVAHYIKVTQDLTILEENIPFIKGELLKDDQHEAYFIPEKAQEVATVLEHCRRAINKGITAGPHGLPLIGGGDWNDGMNLVGIQGRGESVWLAFFLIQVMNDFADVLQAIGQNLPAEGFRTQAHRLAAVVEATAWDGEWYRRAYYDNGTPLGAQGNLEDSIDSLPQSWAAISQAADPIRTRQSLESVRKYLVKERENLLLLLTPPFDKTEQNPGYIKGYPPGVRENGGQYTHGSLWVAMAFARIGDADTAVELLQMLLPANYILSNERLNSYKIEPYVLSGDVYALSASIGRGGWSWYTGSASWMYRIWLEEIFGFTLRGNKLSFFPRLPKQWESIKIHYTHHNTLYKITIENPHHKGVGEIHLELDGVAVEKNEIPLSNDGIARSLRVIIF